MTTQYVGKKKATTINKKYYSGNVIHNPKRPMKKAGGKMPKRSQWSPPKHIIMTQVNKQKEDHQTWRNEKKAFLKRTKQPLISIITLTANLEDNKDRILGNFKQQTYKNKELIVVTSQNAPKIVTVYEKMKNVTVIIVGDTLAGLDANIAIESSNGEFISMMNDNDEYFPNYLLDIFHHTTDHDADVYGKVAFLKFFLQSKTLFCPTIKHQNVQDDIRIPAKGTLFFKRQTWDKIKFAEEEPVNSASFIRAVREAGMSLFSTDLFNYVNNIDKKYNPGSGKGTVIGKTIEPADDFIPKASSEPAQS